MNDGGEKWGIKLPDGVIFTLVISPQSKLRNDYKNMHRKILFRFILLANIIQFTHADNFLYVYSTHSPQPRKFSPLRSLSAAGTMVGSPVHDEGILVEVPTDRRDWWSRVSNALAALLESIFDMVWYTSTNWNIAHCRIASAYAYLRSERERETPSFCTSVEHYEEELVNEFEFLFLYYRDSAVSILKK